MSIEVAELQKAIRELAQRTGRPTQDAQARKLGISDTSLGAYLAGTQIPRESTVITMLAGAGVPSIEHGKVLEIRQKAADVTRPPNGRANGQSSHSSPPLGEEPSRAPEIHPPTWRSIREKFGVWAWVGFAFLLVIVVLGMFALLPSRSPTASPLTTPAPASSSGASTLRCGLVTVASSPVYAEMGTGKPAKFKGFGDRVRLLPLPSGRGSDGTVYQAVALPDPHDSANGVGWMRAADLKSDPRQCAGLGKRP